MRTLDSIQVADVQATYAGPECDLWELLMGAQIHIGGFRSSMQLADLAGIQPGSRGADLCCCRGAGMQFLLQFRQVASMVGVDVTEQVLAEARERTGRAGLGDRTQFVPADSRRTGLPTGGFDFVWGEDAWCYVPDKPVLVAEAARLVRPGGTIAFTDWIEGDTPLTDEEARRFMAFMKFPSLATLADYRRLLERSGCQLRCASHTGRYATCVDLYRGMLAEQFAFDALNLLGGNSAMLEAILGEMAFISQLARENKLSQGVFVANRV